MPFKTASKYKTAQTGFSLLELLLVVAVGGILLLTGFAVYKIVSAQARFNDLHRLTAIIIANSEGKFRQESFGVFSEGDDLSTMFVNLRVFPSSALNGANEPMHPYGGRIVITAGAGGDDAQYVIEFQDIPNAATCINMGLMFDYDNSDQYFSFILDDTEITPTDPPTISAACEAEAMPVDISLPIRID